MNGNVRRRSRRHYKVPVEKVNFKVLHYHKINKKKKKNAKKDPKRGPKSLQHLTFEGEKIKHSTFVLAETAGLEIRKVVP